MTFLYKDNWRGTENYSKKNRFSLLQIAALCLYNIQRENPVFLKETCYAKCTRCIFKPIIDPYIQIKFSSKKLKFKRNRTR